MINTRRTIFVVFVMLLIASPILVGQSFHQTKIDDNRIIINESTPFFDPFLLKYKLCFMIGTPDLIDEHDNKILIRAGKTNIHCFFFFPETKHLQIPYQGQIHVLQSHIGKISENFIFSLCVAYLPKATFEMSIIERNDDENTISFQVDAIKGDPIWEQNVFVWKEPFDGTMRVGTFQKHYVEVGEIYTIENEVDGYFTFTFYERISNDVLYRSGRIKI